MTVSGEVLAGLGAGAVLGAALAWWLAQTRARAAAALAAAEASAREARAVADGEAGRARLEAMLGQERQASEARGRALEERISELQARAFAGEKEHRAAVAELAALREARARLETEMVKDREGHAQRLAGLQDAEDRLSKAFAALSDKALDASTTRFLELAAARFETLKSEAGTDLAVRHEQITGVVAPMRDALQRIGETLAEVELDRTQDRGRLLSELESVKELHRGLQAETQKLERALRVPHVRGRWGELQLQRVVELAGMEEHCDFAVQRTIAGDAGTLRPDLMVTLPGGRLVVVDAKAPVTAYLDAINTDDDNAREARLRDHAAQVRAHVATLGGKAYWDRLPETPDFVVLFLPGESFFSAAVQYDPSLFEFGVSQRVFLAGPFTLLALLRAVAHGWNREKLADSTRAVSELGKELYERIVTLSEHFAELRRKLQGAVDAHNHAIGSLETRVLPSARRFRDLGVTSPRDIETLGPVDQAPRRLQATDMVEPAGDDDHAADTDVTSHADHEHELTRPGSR